MIMEKNQTISLPDTFRVNIQIFFFFQFFQVFQPLITDYLNHNRIVSISVFHISRIYLESFFS